MARLTAAAAAIALGAACALLLVACGGSDAKLLPGRTAEEINENLDAVRQLAAEEECVGAEDQAEEVGAQIESLEGIDPKLKANLEEGADRLNEVVDGCSEESSEETTEEEPDTEEEEVKPPPTKPSKEEKAAEKEAEQEEKEQEAQEKKEEKEAEAPPPEHVPPGHGGEPPGQEKKTEPPSGGIGPGEEAEGEG